MVVHAFGRQMPVRARLFIDFPVQRMGLLAVSSLRDARRLMVVHNLVRIYFQNETLIEQRGAVQSV
jgi:hypothetical protein